MTGASLKVLRRAKGITQAALAEALGVSQQAVAKWEAGLSLPEPGMLLKLASFYGVSTDMLLGRRKQDQPPARIPAASPGAMLGALSGASPGILPDTLPYDPIGHKPVRVVGEVRAGFGLPAEEEDRGWALAAVKDPAQYFYLIVQGDSMEPRIREGDLALIRRQPDLDDGDLGVVVYGEGEGTLKRFHRKGGAVVLQSFNPAYETMILAGQELERLHIMGKVVETKARW